MKRIGVAVRRALGLGFVVERAIRVGSAVAAQGDVKATPDTDKLPGGNVLQELTNGLAGWALVFALIGLLVGAVVWALGAHSQNWHQTSLGKRAVLVSALAALLIGAAPAIVNFFAGQGRAVR